MNTLTSSSYTFAPNAWVSVNDRKLAYRTVGQGPAIVLCMRFRGTMDAWDPAFIDALAARGYQVITFDYSGLGLSTGSPNYMPGALAEDAKDLIEALQLPSVVLGGWSVGGLAVQVAVAQYADRLSV